ncbi:MAG TPA: 2-hydroxyglutaryl-CoA dehydratase [Anaerolineae bacterium]|nr:2-hydroxyglutaryl-CoA dehydratase [Anaerolineae bacterium]
MAEVCALGIDVGSTTAKIVGIDDKGHIVWHLLEQADPQVGKQVERFLELAREVTTTPSDPKDGGQKNGVPLIATGYGRKLVLQATRKVTEITCHARGIYRELGHGGTLVDIGGQDSKVIGISPKGEVIDFSMNDKCAAGTGRFLENTASRLGVALDRLGEVTLSTEEEVPISSTCTVFAESEVISLIAHGVATEPILRGLHRSLVKRVVAMIRSVGLRPPLMLSGGVVLNPAIPHLLQEETGEQVIIPHHPQLIGALGAALIGLDLLPKEI